MISNTLVMDDFQQPNPTMQPQQLPSNTTTMYERTQQLKLKRQSRRHQHNCTKQNLTKLGYYNCFCGCHVTSVALLIASFLLFLAFLNIGFLFLARIPRRWLRSWVEPLPFLYPGLDLLNSDYIYWFRVGFYVGWVIVCILLLFAYMNTHPSSCLHIPYLVYTFFAIVDTISYIVYLVYLMIIFSGPRYKLLNIRDMYKSNPNDFFLVWIIIYIFWSLIQIYFLHVVWRAFNYARNLTDAMNRYSLYGTRLSHGTATRLSPYSQQTSTSYANKPVTHAYPPATFQPPVSSYGKAQYSNALIMVIEDENEVVTVYLDYDHELEKLPRARPT